MNVEFASGSKSKPMASTTSCGRLESDGHRALQTWVEVLVSRVAESYHDTAVAPSARGSLFDEFDLSPAVARLAFLWRG
jgi:hypothetical protein